ARASDVDLLPAWLEVDPEALRAGTSAEREADDELWAAVAGLVADRPAAVLDERAGPLGLPVGRLPAPASAPAAPDAAGAWPLADLAVAATSAGPAVPRRLEGALVVDLSSLWAGPLCGRLLADAGATVVKVESRARPDGARRGPAAFFDLLNAGKA